MICSEVDILPIFFRNVVGSRAADVQLEQLTVAEG